jgi:peptidoglycan/LPS O-acetylase OafA/YrhL
MPPRMPHESGEGHMTDSLPVRPVGRRSAADEGALAPGAADASGFRLDIEGMRGLALVLVLATHADVSFLHGGFVGLDIFFVLSGFLITGLMLKEARTTGRVSLLRFYARRARRILPLAATVLGVMLVVAAVALDPVRGSQAAGDAVAAAGYVVNWHFIARSTDYFAFNDPSVSPVQHYWSLAVEEQFYICWPLLLVAALGLARRLRLRQRLLLWGVVVSLGGASLGYSVWYSPLHVNAAYLSTLTRVWEIGIGCALALALPAAIRLPRLAAAALVAAGLAAIVWAALAYDQTAAYPGWRALVPTLASAAIITGGTATVCSAPTRLLMSSPLRYLGRLSYAWYLWHWPFLVFAADFFGRLTSNEKIAVIALSGIPAVASHYLVEERFRRSRKLGRRPRLAIAVGAACTASALGAGLAVAATRPSLPTAPPGEVLGARVVLAGDRALEGSVHRIRPAPKDAWKDRGIAFAHCQLRVWSPPVSPGGDTCVFGDRLSGTTVVNLGDSHGLMYSSGLIALARKRHWRLVNLTRAGCTVADVEYQPKCDAWRENTLQRVARAHPSLVVVSTATQTLAHAQRYAVIHDGKRLTRAQSEPYLVAGLVRTLRRLRQQTGAKVVVIRDISGVPDGIDGCVAQHPHHLATCAFAPRRPRALAFDARAAHRVPGVKLIDPLPVLCPDDLCPAVIGHALVYRNNYHLTATFSRTLVDWFDRKLPAVTPTGSA